MKNYRKLAEGEVIRGGDQWEIETAHDYVVPGVDTGEPCPPSAVVYRKARTEGCPPGWRWCDAGEITIQNVILGQVFKCVPFKADSDQPSNGDAYVMPYPEDPRLFDEKLGELGEKMRQDLYNMSVDELFPKVDG